MLSAWAAATPAGLAALVFLTVPGLAVAYAAGLRGIPAWGLAPPLSVSLVAMAALAASQAGMDWGPVALVVATAVAVALAWLAGRLVDSPARQDPRAVRTHAAAGALIASVVAGVAVMRGIGDPERVPQTFDAVFHLNAVHRAVESGDASSLSLGWLANPERPSSFYPGGWHGLVALVAELSGAPVIVSISAVSVATAMVWPLGCVLLIRQTLGRSAPVLLAGGALAAGFAAAPFMLLSYGTLWPNALGTVLLPAVIAIGTSVCGVARQTLLDLPRSALVGAAVVPGLVLAHPNIVVTVAVLAVPVTGASLMARYTRRHEPVPVLLWLWGLWLLGVGVLLWSLARSPVFAATRSTDWPARESLAQAAGEALFLAPKGLPVHLILAMLAVIGLSQAVRQPHQRWLAGSHLTTAGLYVLAAGSDSVVSQSLTGPWYNDAFRLGALLPVTGVPLMAVGLVALARWASSVTDATTALPPRGVLGRYAVSVAVLTGLVVATQGMYVRENARVVATWYGHGALVGSDERQLFSRLRELVPADSVIAGNPWNGSALAESLGGRRVLFPHLTGSWGADRTTLANSLVRANSDPSVCPAVSRLGVDYVLSGRSAFWTGDRRQLQYAGLEVAGAVGFEPVASGGRLTLYRVTACREDPRARPMGVSRTTEDRGQGKRGRRPPKL